jgi:hypothetical protein
VRHDLMKDTLHFVTDMALNIITNLKLVSYVLISVAGKALL